MRFVVEKWHWSRFFLKLVLAYLPACDIGDNKCVRNSGKMICRGKLKYYEKAASVQHISHPNLTGTESTPPLRKISNNPP